MKNKLRFIFTFVLVICSVFIFASCSKDEHTHHYIARKTVAPTCTEQGYTEYFCNECFDSYHDDFVPATGHKYKWIIDTPSTETTTGVKHLECSVCHEKRKENTAIPKAYIVTYNLDGGTNNSNNPSLYTIESDDIILQDATKIGYTFLGWFTESNFENQVTKIKNGSSGNITLYAKWELTIDLVIPEGTTSIGTEYQNLTNLKSIVVPNSVESIALGAFSGCSSLEKITLPFVGDCSNSFYNYTSYPICPFGYIFGENEFDGGVKTQQVYKTKPHNINNPVYYYIPSGLKEVTINGGAIFDDAFSNCFNIEKITFGENIYEIRSNLFENCSSLTSIVISKSVRNIYNAFDENNKLTDVYYDGSLSDWCKISISSNPMSYAKNFYLKNSDGEYEKLTEIKIPNNVTEIKSRTFEGFDDITKVSLPSTIKSIDSNAFSECSSLTNVYYDGSLSDWCNIKFSNSYSNPMSYAKHFYLKNSNGKYEELTEIEIPSNITKILDYTFYDFENITKVSLPNTIQNIGKSAFSSCINLISIIIPVSVNSIDSSAFNNYNSLTKVYYGGNTSDWLNIEFGSQNTNLISVSIYYYSATEPTETGNYWHYAEDGITVVEW